jgi:hypothetical protein
MVPGGGGGGVGHVAWLSARVVAVFVCGQCPGSRTQSGPEGGAGEEGAEGGGGGVLLLDCVTLSRLQWIPLFPPLGPLPLFPVSDVLPASGGERGWAGGREREGAACGHPERPIYRPIYRPKHKHRHSDLLTRALCAFVEHPQGTHTSVSLMCCQCVAKCVANVLPMCCQCVANACLCQNPQGAHSQLPSKYACFFCIFFINFCQ